MSGRKNQIERITVTDINPDGNGVGRTEDGKVVFIPLAAPGDTVDVKIIKETSDYLIGRLETLVFPSPCRIEPDCPVYARCGSCSFLHLSESFENQKKRELVQSAFSRIGKLQVEVEETRSFSMSRYRNKVVYPLAEQNGVPVFGYYARHSHSLIPHEDCPLQDPRFSEIGARFCEEVRKLHIPVWNESAKAGVLRYLSLRKNRAGMFSLLFVASRRFREERNLAERMMNAFPFIQGVSININKAPDNVILGEETISLLGIPVLEDILCGKRFLISPASFYQINADCAEALYRTASDLLALKSGDVVMDLYCGSGTIGLSVIQPGQKLIGVEIVPDSVRDAEINARMNGRTESDTVMFLGDASAGFSLCEAKFGKPDAIVVDPPRKGLSDDVIMQILQSGCEKVVYISCNPVSLAKDCARLCDRTYLIQKVIPFNMFPRTGHVETVVCLSNKNAKLKDYVEIGVDAEDYYRIKDSKKSE